MYLVTDDERVVPCGYDQGSDCFVIKIFNFSDEDNYVSVNIDGEHFAIIDWDIDSTTRRTVFIWVECEGDDDSQSDESEYSESEYSESEDSEEEEPAYEDEGECTPSISDYYPNGVPKYLFGVDEDE